MKFFEKTITSEDIFKGKVFSVKKETVKLPDDTNAYREVVIHPGGVGILPIDNNKNIILVRQFRKGAESEVLEIPAGKIELNESIESCAKRELLEETGYVSDNIKYLGEYFPTPAYCSEIIRIFLATDLKYIGQKLDEGEFLELVKLKFNDAYKMVLSNEIKDAKTVIAILKAKEILK